MFHTRHLKQNQRGFSLFETVIAVTILFIASTGSIRLFVQAAQMTSTSKHYTEATYAARAHMEEIKNTDFDDITTVFPEYTQNLVLDTALPDEAIWFVTYPNGVSADPLQVLATVSWPENGDTKSLSLTTEVASP